MNEYHISTMKVGNNTYPVTKVDWHLEYEPVELPKYNFREMFNKPIEGKIEGTFTPGEGLNAFIDSIFRDYHSSETLVYISRQTHLELLYLAQGKRYPRLKKRKNKVRMSKKWRNRV